MGAIARRITRDILPTTMTVTAVATAPTVGAVAIAATLVAMVTAAAVAMAGAAAMAGIPAPDNSSASRPTSPMPGWDNGKPMSGMAEARQQDWQRSACGRRP